MLSHHLASAGDGSTIIVLKPCNTKLSHCPTDVSRLALTPCAPMVHCSHKVCPSLPSSPVEAGGNVHSLQGASLECLAHSQGTELLGPLGWKQQETVLRRLPPQQTETYPQSFCEKGPITCPGASALAAVFRFATLLVAAEEPSVNIGQGMPSLHCPLALLHG